MKLKNRAAEFGFGLVWLLQVYGNVDDVRALGLLNFMYLDVGLRGWKLNFDGRGWLNFLYLALDVRLRGWKLNFDGRGWLNFLYFDVGRGLRGLMMNFDGRGWFAEKPAEGIHKSP